MATMHSSAHKDLTRDALTQAFLQTTPWKEASQQPLKKDASHRHYTRLTQHHETTLLMDMPPPEKFKEFIDIALYLKKMGFSVPNILAHDANGFAIIEDFGASTLTQTLQNAPEKEQHLYEIAIDTLVALHHTIPHHNEAHLPLYDTEALNKELIVFLEWFPQLTRSYLHGHYPSLVDHITLPTHAISLTAQQKEDFLSLWKPLFDHLMHTCQPTLVLRDYHVDNIMLLDRPMPQTCGILDFQDALWGSPIYDVASLLEDARRDITPSLIPHLIERYTSQRPDINLETFTYHYDVLALQRSLKILGIFTRLSQRDHKHDYLAHMPRLYAYVRHHLNKARFKDIKAWLHLHIPYL